MQVAWAVVASTAGGAPPTSSACWSAVSVSRRSQDRHWLRDRRATYAAVLRVYTRIEFDLRSACYQDKRTRIDWAPWGAALASLSLVASEEVAAATSRFTEAMREFKTFGLGGKRTKDDGLQLAAQVLAQAQMGFVNAARRSLDHSQRPCPGSSAVPPPAPPAHASQE